MLISLENVSKRYDKELFTDFSLTIDRNDRKCIFGASGTGKTTVLAMLMGLAEPDSGSIRVHEGLRISAVFQEDRLIEHLGAIENIWALSGHKADRKKASAALAALGIEEGELEKPVSQWSGGMRRRLSIARAMLFPADLVIMDEPFTGLDSESKERAAVFIEEHLEGKALVLVSHLAEDAQRLKCETVSL